MCQTEGRITIANVVDHKKPHKGDYSLFFDSLNVQSLCKPHHDGAKQSIERKGFDTAIGQDGFPADPQHPFNR
jgi:hypothetical protein